MFVVLLGYFKSKPVPINPKYGQIKEDLKFVANTILPGQGLRPFKLAQRDKDRLYSRIFELLGHSTWKEKDHQEMLSNALFEQASSWAAPRVLFDAAIGYLTHQKIAIPGYTTLQDTISRVLIRYNKLWRLRSKRPAAEI